MTNQLIKMIKINGLQYNALRDPQVYRRVAGEAFRIQALIGGPRSARVTVADEQGRLLAQQDVQAQGTFSHELSFTNPGVHIVTVAAHHADLTESHDLRLDVMQRAWVG